MSIQKKKLAVTMTSLVGVLIFAVIVIIVNRLFNPVNIRMDCTEGKIYTLSEGTRHILKNLDKHVSIRFYYSRDVADMPVYLKTYAARVEDLLDEYKRLGGKNLEVKKLNPKPDSDAEDSANMDGVTGHSTDALGMGDQIYLGIAVSCAGKITALPFLSPDKESLLEYDLTRAISQVQITKKARIGVMSAIQVMGGIDNPQAMMMGQGGMKPAWAVINELKQAFEVVEVPLTSEAIADDIDLLLLLHPKEIGDAALFAIDQFVLRGGRLLAFVDPLCMVDMQNQQQQQYMPPMPSTLGALFDAWGVSFEAGKVVVDRKLATRIRTGQGADVLPTVITLGKSEISGDDPATSALNNMLVFCAGAFTGDPAEGLVKTVLLNSSDDVQLMESFMTQRNGEDILRSFRSDERKKDLAVKLTGTFKTAFPQGKPGAVAEAAEKKDSESETVNYLTASSKPGAVVLVADADMLYDAFCVSATNLFGQKIVQPINDNLNFALNMVENLLGDNALFAIRSRATTSRPFTRVRDIQADAEKKFQDKIVRIETDLQKVQQDITDLQRKRQKGERELLSREQRELLKQFRKKEAEAKQELKAVRKQLRQDIDNLENHVMMVNIALMPVLVVIGGIVLAVIKRRRNVRK
ncbi:MAG: Gldg family protein [Lentisphaeria bacterium]